jgi:hypothetical protein
VEYFPFLAIFTAMIRLSSLLIHVVLTTTAVAQSGMLDPTFGGDGIVQIDLMPNGDTGYDVLPTNDGRLYVCGYQNDGSQDNGYLLRLLEDGSPIRTSAP